MFSADLALSVQVLQEFYVQATRASRADPLDHRHAAGLVEAFLRFPVQELTGIVLAALATHDRFGISYWDAAILEAARALRCDVVLSEDRGSVRTTTASASRTPSAASPRATLRGGAAWARWPSRSSKPVRSCSPRLGRFDSGAAPLSQSRLPDGPRGASPWELGVDTVPLETARSRHALWRLWRDCGTVGGPSSSRFGADAHGSW